MQALIARHAPFVLGFLLVVNLYLIPHAGTSPRMTDLLAGLLGLWLLMRADRRGLPPVALTVSGVLGLFPLCWLVLSVLDGDRTTAILAARWLLALPWALALTVLLRDGSSRTGFARGLLVGCGVNALVVMMQFAGLDAVLRPLGISSTDSEMATWALDQARLPGLHRHYGASSAVTSLIAPVALHFYLRGRHGVWLPLLALGALAVTLQITLTRSPVLVTGVTVGLGLLLAQRTRQAVTLGGILFLAVVPALVVFGPPGGKARWTDELSFQANADERFDSTWAAVELALEHPLGMGSEQARLGMLQRGPITATHNAFLQAAVIFGLPVALLLLAGLLRHVTRLTRGAQDPGHAFALLALQVMGLFFFEEHLNNPTFVILAAWLATSAAQSFGREGLADAALAPTPTSVR